MFTAELSARDRITAVKKKLHWIDSLIHEVTMLRNEIAKIKKAGFLSKSSKKWTHQESKQQPIQSSKCNSKKGKGG